ncbi:MAG: FxsA family protein [Pseudomonadota bacterium]
MWIFLLLIAVPLTEIGLFIWIGDEIGLWTTLAIVVATALLGAVTLRRQGLQTFQKLSNLRADQEAPIVLIEGLLIAAAGLLLLTPGFLTDTIGFLFLIPPVRVAIARRAAARAVVYAARGMEARASQGEPSAASPHSSDPPHAEPRPSAVRRPDPAPRRSDAEDATVIDDDPTRST